jgi:2-methylcitrate dehydratase PrpD
MTIAGRIAGWTTGLAYDQIPPEVADAAKLHLLDTLGCALAATGTGVAGEGRDMVCAAGGQPDATVVGRADRLPAPAAAFANAMLSHGLDFDDTHSDSMTHVGAVVGPASLAAAEALAVNGRDLLCAIVAGGEIVTRIGMAVTGQFHARGFHATAVCGVFGAAAAACRLSHAPAAVATSALGMSGSFAGGLFAYLDEGTATKPIHPAWAAQGGLMAADLARRGAEGPSTIFEGRFGLYHAFIGAEPGSVTLEEQLADLGERWETPRIAYKPYPVCHFIHGALGATASLLPELDAAQIAQIEVTVPAPAVPIVLEPSADKSHPRTEYEGKFSLPYSTAAMIVSGKVDIGTFGDSALADQAILDLAGKVSYTVRDYATWPAAFPGGVRITTGDGRVLEADQPHQLGAPENPMSAQQVVAKFRRNASLALDEACIEELEHAVLEIEQATDIEKALAPLTRARGPVVSA